MSVEFLIDCLMSFRRELMQLMSQPSSCFRSPLWYDTALFLLPLVIGYAYTSLTFVLISFSGGAHVALERSGRCSPSP